MNQPGNSGLTALHIAAMCGHHEVRIGCIYCRDVVCVQALLEGSIDVNQPGNSGLTALHIAAMCGHHEVIQITHR